MKNLENFEVQELNTNEKKEVNGGWVVKAITGLVFWHWDNWDDIKAGFAEGSAR